MWEALKILDAADAVHPESSSEVYGALNRLFFFYQYGNICGRLVPIFCVDLSAVVLFVELRYTRREQCRRS